MNERLIVWMMVICCVIVTAAMIYLAILESLEAFK